MQKTKTNHLSKHDHWQHTSVAKTPYSRHNITMFYTVSTPPGCSASIPPLAPPFDNSSGLQSNAYITSYSGTLQVSSRGETQVGLGILFGGSDSSPRVDSSGIPVDDDPFLEDPSPFLDSLRPPSLNTLSAESLCLRYPPTPEDDARAAGGDLHASSSSFSIRDWIIHPSSSPTTTSDALCGSSTDPHQCEVAPDALSRPLATGTLVNVNLPSPVLAYPGTPTVIKAAVPAASQTRSPPTNTDNSHGSMQAVFLQVVERICFGHAPATACLSPNQTLVSRMDCASPDVSELPSPQPPDVIFAGFDIVRSPGRLITTPIEATRELASNNIFNVGTSLLSSRDTLSSRCSNGLLVSPDTPVFNIHEGISECDLQRRANRYRRRYPGRNLDRHWLLKYAGKLNKDGKAIQDYRCYISGCAQVNKRRDHIIVHICSHVNERPFACRHWFAALSSTRANKCKVDGLFRSHMTFLRRNECKRHEAGHSGLKPFVCRFCSPPSARFARQDLLTRHARRAHGMNPRDQRERLQQAPEMVGWSGKNGPVQKSARMGVLHS